MLLLFESAAGFALFKVLKDGALKETEDVGADFASLDQAQKVRAAAGLASENHVPGATTPVSLKCCPRHALDGGIPGFTSKLRFVDG